MTGLEITITHLILGILGTIATMGITTWKVIIQPFSRYREDQAAWKTGVEKDIQHLKTKVGSQMDEIREELKEIKASQTEMKQAIATLSERSKH